MIPDVLYAERFHWVPLEEATKAPPGLVNHIVDSWWTYIPTMGIAFYRHPGQTRYFGYPQCNTDKLIALSVAARTVPAAGVLFLPSVFVPHRCDQ